MIHDTVIKVGGKSIEVIGDRTRRELGTKAGVGRSSPHVTAKVVAPPERKAPRKSSGAVSKEG